MDNFIYSLFSCGIGYMCIYIYNIYSVRKSNNDYKWKITTFVDVPV